MMPGREICPRCGGLGHLCMADDPDACEVNDCGGPACEGTVDCKLCHGNGLVYPYVIRREAEKTAKIQWGTSHRREG